jgi:hypothetical protein
MLYQYYENTFTIKMKYLILIYNKKKLSNNEIRSVSYLQIISSKDLGILTEIFQEFWNIKSEIYNDLIINKILSSKDFLSNLLP